MDTQKYDCWLETWKGRSITRLEKDAGLLSSFVPKDEILLQPRSKAAIDAMEIPWLSKA